MSPPPQPSGVSHILTLPNEILDNITECMLPSELSIVDNTEESRRDLRSLSLVCKRLHDATTFALYRHIHISSAKQLYRLVLKLRTSPELVHLIRKLSLSPTPCHYVSGRKDLSWLLCSTTSLQTLLLSMGICRGCSPYAHRMWQLGDVPLNGRSIGCLVAWGVISEGIETSQRGGPDSSQFLPRLETVYLANPIYPQRLWQCHSLFSIPSLRNVVCLDDRASERGLKKLNLGGYSLGDCTNRIKTFKLWNTGLTPAGISDICASFPALQVLNITNDQVRTRFNLLRLIWTQKEELEKVNPRLAKMTELTQLSLDYHIQLHEPDATVCQALGPIKGITGLAGLENLTKLTIGMHFLMRPIDFEATEGHEFRPLSIEVLPKSLRELQLYTCFGCWYHDASPAESTGTFLGDLGNEVDRFPHLEQVLYYCKTSWWDDDTKERRSDTDDRTSDDRTVDRRTGEIWYPGSLRRCASALSARGVYFRARESAVFTCAEY